MARNFISCQTRFLELCPSVFVSVCLSPCQSCSARASVVCESSDVCSGGPGWQGENCEACPDSRHSCSHCHVAFVLLITNLRFLQPPLRGSHRHVAFVLLITNLRFLQPLSCGVRTLDNQPPLPAATVMWQPPSCGVRTLDNQLPLPAATVMWQPPSCGVRTLDNQLPLPAATVMWHSYS